MREYIWFNGFGDRHPIIVKSDNIDQYFNVNSLQRLKTLKIDRFVPSSKLAKMFYL